MTGGLDIQLPKHKVEEIEKQLDHYTKKKEVFDFVLAGVQDSSIGKRYDYHTDECVFSIDPSFQDRIDRKEVSADMCFINQKDNAVMLIEETEFPEQKQDQLRGYCFLHGKAVQAVTKTDVFPDVDVLLVVPYEKRGEAKRAYEKLDDDPSTKKLIGGRIGLTVWYWTRGRRKLVRICGKHKSGFLGGLPGTITVRQIDLRIPILKSAPAVEVLRFLYLKLLENELGGENPHFTEVKIRNWLGKFGIHNMKKVRAAFELGRDIGFLNHVDLDTLYAEPRYAKDHPRSLAAGTYFLNDPIGFMKSSMDQDQKSLRDFLENEPERPDEEEE